MSHKNNDFLSFIITQCDFTTCSRGCKSLRSAECQKSKNDMKKTLISCDVNIQKFFGDKTKHILRIVIQNRLDLDSLH